MLITLSEEQTLLRETARKAAQHFSKWNAGQLSADSQGWRRLAEAGLLSLRLSPEAGGIQPSGVEVILIVEELARVAAPVPYLGSAVLASELLRLAGAGPELQNKLSRGDIRLSIGLDPMLQGLATMSNSTVVAWDGEEAIACLAVEPTSAGHSLVAIETAAGTQVHSADISRKLIQLRGDASRLAIGDLGGPLVPESLSRWASLALTSLAADSIGVMEAALDLAVAYAKERIQFGRPIGTFQAIQHLCADCKVMLESARSCVWYAAWAVDHLEPPAAHLAARTAKAIASETSRTVIESAIQVHGGLGMTWETMPHVLLRRALMDRATLGDERVHLIALGREMMS